MVNSFIDAVRNCVPFLSDSFRADHQRFFLDENLSRFSNRLVQFHQSGVPDGFPPPHLDVECTPPLGEAYAPFADVLHQWSVTADPTDEAILRRLAESLQSATTPNILVILGQRFTPASLTDHRALPPAHRDLLNAANAPYVDRLSSAARALTKHLQRSEEEFWGTMRGSDEEKSNTAASLITKILEQATWWNVFGHYKHDIVFEARVEAGYGARWGDDGQQFIGFLEPFTSDFPSRRD